MTVIVLTHDKVF